MPKNRLTNDILKFEEQSQQQGYRLILGIDEAGRGPLAGPVVAAAVALKDYHFEHNIRDSKQLTAQAREKAFHEILAKAYVGIGIISETAIDEINILQATFVAMTNAVWQLLSRVPERAVAPRNHKFIHLLVDGNRFKTDLPFSYRTIVDGDVHCFSISCASIVAKVTRDRILENYSKIFPQYGFAKHKGYPTREHRQAIQKYGPSMIHRKTFQCRVD